MDAYRTLLESIVTDNEILNIGSSNNILIQKLAETVRNQLALELTRKADSEHTRTCIEIVGEVIGYQFPS